MSEQNNYYRIEWYQEPDETGSDNPMWQEERDKCPGATWKDAIQLWVDRKDSPRAYKVISEISSSDGRSGYLNMHQYPSHVWDKEYVRLRIIATIIDSSE